jgi:putative oxidoreductase
MGCQAWSAAWRVRGLINGRGIAMINGASPMFENLIVFVARLLLATIFVHEGLFLAANFNVAATGMAKLGVPAPLLAATLVLQLVAGLAITAGWYARTGAVALGLFCLATAILFHNNFTNRNELLQFEKDIAIAGGMFLLMLRGAGAWSIDAIVTARKQAREVPTALAPRIGSSA